MDNMTPEKFRRLRDGELTPHNSFLRRCIASTGTADTSISTFCFTNRKFKTLDCFTPLVNLIFYQLLSLAKREFTYISYTGTLDDEFEIPPNIRKYFQKNGRDSWIFCDSISTISEDIGIGVVLTITHDQTSGSNSWLLHSSFFTDNEIPYTQMEPVDIVECATLNGAPLIDVDATYKMRIFHHNDPSRLGQYGRMNKRAVPFTVAIPA